jgi:hypothetical protein
MPQTALSVNDFSARFLTSKYANFTALTAGTQIKLGQGTFFGVYVNTAGTVASSITLYDGTSTAGPVIGIFNTLATAQIRGNTIAFKNGLFAVVAGTTSGNITVFYL